MTKRKARISEIVERKKKPVAFGNFHCRWGGDTVSATGVKAER